MLDIPMIRTEGSIILAPGVAVYQTAGGPEKKSALQQDAFFVATRSSPFRPQWRALFNEISDSLETSLPEDTFARSGSTAMLAYTDSGDSVTTAHVGNSRATLFARHRASRAVSSIPLSTDHSAANAYERQRIAGHERFFIEDSVLRDRENPTWWLSMTRAFGDAVWKDVVLHEPSIETWDLSDFKNDFDLYLCLDSDGAHENVSPEERLETLRNHFFRGAAITPAETLANLAVEKGSRDNITVLFAPISGIPAAPLVLGVFDGHGRMGHDVAAKAAYAAQAILGVTPV